MEVRELEARALEHERRIGRASGKEALDIAVQTVQLYLDACEKATISSDRIRIKRKLKEVFALAERIKKANQNAQNVQNAPSIPQSTRSMTTAEKTIIWRSSLLHNNKFPPWESAPDASVFAETGADDHLYTWVQNSLAISSILPTPLTGLMMTEKRPLVFFVLC